MMLRWLTLSVPFFHFPPGKEAWLEEADRKRKEKKKEEDRNGGWPMLIEKPEMWEINKL